MFSFLFYIIKNNRLKTAIKGMYIMNNIIKYEKITDDLYILGVNSILRFNVSLANKNQDGKKRLFHSEFEYRSDKYIDINSACSIRRTFDYFLSIENMRNTEQGVKEFIMIRIQDILYVREQFELATKWFRDAKYQNLFANSKGKLVMLGKVEPIKILGLAMGKSIMLEPIVISYDESNQTTGVRLYLSSLDNYVDMSVDKFMGLVYLLSSINMYESAQILLNYLQRPELGTNNFNMNNRPDDYEADGYVEDSRGKNVTRKINDSKRQKSFFEKMNEL